MSFLKYLFGGKKDDSKSKVQTIDGKLIRDIIDFAESSKSKALTGGVKMREGFFRDLYHLIGVRGTIPYSEVQRETLKYTLEMYQQFEKNAGEINTFFKGVIAYEVSCAIGKIYSNEDKMDFFNELFPASLKEDKQFNTTNNRNADVGSEQGKEYHDISDELVFRLAGRGLLKLTLASEKSPKYGYIEGRMSPMGGGQIKYNFRELIDYDENNPLDDDEYPMGIEIIDLENIKSVKSLATVSKERLNFEEFDRLMQRLDIELSGDFSYDITPQGNVLVLRSNSMNEPTYALAMINIMLESDNDWHVFNKMNFDLIIFKGEDVIYKFTNEQMHEIFIRR